MRKLLFLMLVILMSLSACQSTEDEIPFLDVKSSQIDTSTLRFIDANFYNENDTNYFDSTNYDSDILSVSKQFIDYAADNFANLYGPLFPSRTLAVFNFENDQFDNIQITVYSTAKDPTVIFIGIDIFDITDNMQLLYYNVYTAEFKELLDHNNN